MKFNPAMYVDDAYEIYMLYDRNAKQQAAERKKKKDKIKVATENNKLPIKSCIQF